MASNRPWLEINGVKSTTIAGLLITSVPPVAKPPRRYQLQTVDGLNGDIRTDLGYAAHDRTVGIGLAGTYDEDAIIAFFDQSGTVIFSNEPDKVYTFDGIEGFAMERLARMRQAEIILHVQPFKTSAEETETTITVETETDNTPYILRPTNGGYTTDVTAVTEKIVGGSVAWNQLIENGNFADGTDGWTKGSAISSLTATGGVLTFAYSAGTSNTNRCFASTAFSSIPTGTVVMIGFTLRRTGDDFNVNVALASSATMANTNRKILNDIPTSFQRYGIILTTDTEAVKRLVFGTRSATTDVAASYELKDVVLYNLTAMFGEPVASAIAAMETDEEGAGVAWFRQSFPAAYYATNAGEVISVNASAHEMTGFNLLDEDTVLTGLTGITKTDEGWTGLGTQWITSTNVNGWEGITYMPGVSYCAAAYIVSAVSTNVRVRWRYTDGTYTQGNFIQPGADGVSVVASDPSKTISRMQITYGSNAGNITFKWANISISNADRNGTHEAYTKTSYPLDSSLILRGVPKLDTGNLYYDGDTYEADGTVTRKFAEVDLGDLTWSYSSINGYYSSSELSVPCKIIIDGRTIPEMVVSRGYVISSYAERADKTVGQLNNGRIFVVDSAYTTSADLKAALVGVMVVYWIETETTETADAFTVPQAVDAYGTEAYAVTETDGVAIPVGHESTYLVEGNATITNEGNRPSEPTLVITGSGFVGVYLDDVQKFRLNLGSGKTITIDTHEQEAFWADGTFANRAVVGEYSRFRIPPGAHVISISGGVTSASIDGVSLWT